MKYLTFLKNGINDLFCRQDSRRNFVLRVSPGRTKKLSYNVLSTINSLRKKFFKILTSTKIRTNKEEMKEIEKSIFSFSHFYREHCTQTTSMIRSNLILKRICKQSVFRSIFAVQTTFQKTFYVRIDSQNFLYFVVNTREREILVRIIMKVY